MVIIGNQAHRWGWWWYLCGIFDAERWKKHATPVQYGTICHRARTIIIISSACLPHQSSPSCCIGINPASFILIIACLWNWQSQQRTTGTHLGVKTSQNNSFSATSDCCFCQYRVLSHSCCHLPPGNMCWTVGLTRFTLCRVIVLLQFPLQCGTTTVMHLKTILCIHSSSRRQIPLCQKNRPFIHPSTHPSPVTTFNVLETFKQGYKL